MNTSVIVADINEILSRHGISEIMQRQDIQVTDKTISDILKPGSKLSNAITNSLWPSIDTETVYHYTSREAAEKILATNTFRLSNIEKRLNDGEIVTFCETHALNGYLEKDENGLPQYQSLLMPQLFYASFTETSLSHSEEEYFWQNFATSDGVRLTVKITATNQNFRKIRYEPNRGEPIQLLADLTSTLREKHGREFVLQGMSRLCAFYLNGQDYSREKEYRILYRTWPGEGPQPKGSGRDVYVELPINQKTILGYEIGITEVHANTRPNMPDCYVFSKRTH